MSQDSFACDPYHMPAVSSHTLGATWVIQGVFLKNKQNRGPKNKKGSEEVQGM